MGLSFKTWGTPDHPALLMLHGLFGFGSDWEQLALALSPDYFCIAPDLPGHGRTDLNDFAKGDSFKNTSAALIALLEQLEIGEATLLGYSMGGRIACHTAVTHPKWFAGLILESASPGLKTAGEREERLKIDLARGKEIEGGVFQNFLEQWYQQPLFQFMQRQPGRLGEVIQDRLRQDPRKLARAVDIFSIGRQPNLSSPLSVLQMPVLLIVGELDEKYRHIASEIAALRRGKTAIRVIPDVGHNAHWEAPVAFTEAVKTFLQD